MRTNAEMQIMRLTVITRFKLGRTIEKTTQLPWASNIQSFTTIIRREIPEIADAAKVISYSC